MQSNPQQGEVARKHQRTAQDTQVHTHARTHAHTTVKRCVSTPVQCVTTNAASAPPFVDRSTKSLHTLHGNKSKNSRKRKSKSKSRSKSQCNCSKQSKSKSKSKSNNGVVSRNHEPSET